MSFYFLYITSVAPILHTHKNLVFKDMSAFGKLIPHHSAFFVVFIYLFVVLVFELRALSLLGMCSKSLGKLAYFSVSSYREYYKKTKYKYVYG
jgi:hypothetical protein